MPSIRATLVALALPLAPAAFAQEAAPSGLTVDGAARAMVQVEGQGNWVGSDGAADANLRLSADPAAATDGFLRLQLSFGISEGKADIPELVLTKGEGDAAEYWRCSDEQGGLVVTLEAAEFAGDSLSARGSFTCKASHSDRGGKEIDTSRSHEVAGHFDVVLPRL